ncbi:TonB-dependent receptor P3 [Chitinophaga sp. MM2321]
MKITAVLLIAVFLQVRAEKTNAQNISISERNTSLERVFKEIHRKTGFQFFYKVELLQQAKTFDINVKNASVEQVLELCFKGQPLNFTITKNTITIRGKEETQPVKAPDAPPALIQVRGNVNDEKGKPLPGVTILVVGGKRGTSTDEDGNFSISVQENAALRFSHLGYETVKIAVNGKAQLDVILHSADFTSLNDVVVVGYGTVKKRDLTGAVSSISEDAATDRIVTSLADVMKGRAAGVQITESDGSPGSESSIRIRGAGSINGSNEPLYVIDGIIGTGEDVSPADIASIEILKDASSTAIYGSRGANGVVLITTKSGSKGKTKVDIYANYGLQRIPHELEMMKAADYVHMRYDQNVNYFKKGTTTIDSLSYYDAEENIYKLPADRGAYGYWDGYNSPDSINTNWQDLMFQEVLTKDIRLNVSGGDAKQTYSLLLNYFGQNGIIPNSSTNNFSGRFNFNQKLHKNLSLNLNLNANTKNIKGVFGGDSKSVVMNTLSQPPTKPITSSELDLFPEEAVGVNNNPYYQVNNQTINRFNNGLVSSLTLNWKINDNFSFQTQNSYINKDASNENYYPSNTQQGYSANGVSSLSFNKQINLTTENLLFYNKKFGKSHAVNALLGASYNIDRNKKASLENRNFAVEELGINAIGLGINPQIPKNNFNESSLASLFTRLNYSYMDRYLFTATLRRDGSSRFGKSNKFANFPSGAFAWRVIEEKFLQKQKTLSDLKVRLSWGQSGQEAIPAYQSIASLNTAIYPMNGVDPTFGLAINSTPNPSLKWETTTQTDIGLEVGLLDNMFHFTFDVYNKVTRDMLNQVTTPLSTGYKSYWTNLGSIQNQGLEISMNAAVIRNKHFNWNVTYNMGFNRSKVIELNQNGYIQRNPSGNFQSMVNIIQEGYPLGLWYGFKKLGVYQSQSQIDKSGITSIFGTDISKYEPGSYIIEDINHDGVIDNGDQQILGKGTPDFSGGFINRFSYKGFDLSVVLQFSYGADIVNATRVRLSRLQSWSNQMRDLNDRWFPTLYTINPDETRGDLFIEGSPSDQYKRKGFFADDHLYSDNIENGSFIRLSDVTLAYTIPIKAIRALKISNIKLFASGKNLYVLTRYLGYDPEVGTSNSNTLAPGMDWSAYPKPRIVTLGANITF